MKTEINETGHLSSRLTIILEPQDYQKKFETELRKYKEKSHLKGFRKGKTPLTAIRKMYGKAVLAEVVNEKLQSSLAEYISNEKLDLLGNPLPAENQEEIELDPKSFGDFEFQFDLGLAPKFDVIGVGETAAYDEYKVVIDDGLIDKEIENMQRRYGVQEETEEPIEELDILTVYAVERSEEEKDLYTTEFSIMVERMTEQYKSVFTGQKIGFKTQVDIFDFETNSTEEYVRKYLIKDAPEEIDVVFDVEIKAVKRLVPASLEQELFDKAFGENEVKDEEGARNKLREGLQEHYDNQGLAITKRFILEGLVEANDLSLPDEFLKRWLLESNKELDEVQMESEFEAFSKNLKWTLIKKELGAKYSIEITPDQIKESVISKLKRQFANYNYEGMNYEEMAMRVMQNEESIHKEYDELQAEAVLRKVREEVEMKTKEIDLGAYEEIVQQLQANVG